MCAVSGGHPSLRCTGSSCRGPRAQCRWLSVLVSWWLLPRGARDLPRPGSNQCPLFWQTHSYPQYRQGSPFFFLSHVLGHQAPHLNPISRGSSSERSGWRGWPRPCRSVIPLFLPNLLFHFSAGHKQDWQERQTLLLRRLHYIRYPSSGVGQGRTGEARVKRVFMLFPQTITNSFQMKLNRCQQTIGWRWRGHLPGAKSGYLSEVTCNTPMLTSNALAWPANSREPDKRNL